MAVVPSEKALVGGIGRSACPEFAQGMTIALAPALLRAIARSRGWLDSILSGNAASQCDFSPVGK
jgi:hypothetical protein